jgi:hypothetical protein
MTMRYVWPDRKTKAGYICDSYRWEGSEASELLASFGRRFSSALELKNALIKDGLTRFSVSTAASDPIVLETDCSPEILIDRFLANGLERWQSLVLNGAA